MCAPDAGGRPKDRSVPASQLDLPQDMIGVLEVMRALFGSWSGLPKPGALTASDIAEAWFGRGTGLPVAEQVILLATSMRQVRRSTFRFSNPQCPVCRDMVTPHEQALLCLVSHSRAGRKAKARVSAIIICEGHDESTVVAAARRLGAILDSLSEANRSLAPIGRRTHGRQ